MCQLHEEEMKVLTAKVATILKEKCPEAAKAISDAYVPSKGMLKDVSGTVC